jgi:hypothetical protein
MPIDVSRVTKTLKPRLVHLGLPVPRPWVQRLRDVHPQLAAALDGEALFEKQEDN